MTKIILMQTEINKINIQVCKRTEIIKTNKDIDEILALMGCSEERIAEIKMKRFKMTSDIIQGGLDGKGNRGA